MAKKKPKQVAPISGYGTEHEARDPPEWQEKQLEIGRRIALLRGEKSQAEFARWLAMHKNTLARYERGERMPDANFLLALNVATGANPAWVLLGDEGGPVRVRDGVKIAPLDRDALRDVIQVVEEFLQERKLALEPTKKAELLVLIYEDIREQDGKVDRARVIRLVNLAA